MAPAPGARIVEIGCGTARNLIRIARAILTAALFGLDASARNAGYGRGRHRRAGLANRIKLAIGYAEALSPAAFGETAPFDNILFSYSLSMIPDWKLALNAATGALSANGRVHIVDFGDLRILAGPARAVLRTWLELFHVAPRAELLSALEEAGRRQRPALYSAGSICISVQWRCGKLASLQARCCAIVTVRI